MLAGILWCWAAKMVERRRLGAVESLMSKPEEPKGSLTDRVQAQLEARAAFPAPYEDAPGPSDDEVAKVRAMVSQEQTGKVLSSIIDD